MSQADGIYLFLILKVPITTQADLFGEYGKNDSEVHLALQAIKETKGQDCFLSIYWGLLGVTEEKLTKIKH